MGHFKFKWNDISESVEFEGDWLDFSRTLSSYLLHAEDAESKMLATSLGTAIEDYKAFQRDKELCHQNKEQTP